MTSALRSRQWGPSTRYRQENDGTQPGDPARAAKVISDVVGADAPPRRLILGSDAVTSAQKAANLRAAETEKWADVSRSAWRHPLRGRFSDGRRDAAEVR
jgi:hypothetical protein